MISYCWVGFGCALWALNSVSGVCVASFPCLELLETSESGPELMPPARAAFLKPLPSLLPKITLKRGSEPFPFPPPLLTFCCFSSLSVELAQTSFAFQPWRWLRGHCLLWEHMNCSVTQVDHFKISRKFLEFPGLVCVLWWEPGCESWTSQNVDTRVWLGMWGNLRSAWEKGDSYLFL